MAKRRTKKMSTTEKFVLGGVAALLGYGAYRYATAEEKVAGFDGVGDVDDDYSSLNSSSDVRAARSQSAVARETARQARLAARTQRQREAQARAAAQRAAREAVALEQRADTAERAAAHADALVAYRDTGSPDIYA